MKIQILFFLLIFLIQIKTETCKCVCRNTHLEVQIVPPKLSSNPFDYSAVHYEIQFLQDSSIKAQVESFWFQDYSRTKNPDGTEKLTVNGQPMFVARWSYQNVKAYEYRVKLFDSSNNGNVVCDNLCPSCSQVSQVGVIKVGNNKKYFQDPKTQETYFPIGENVCWSVKNNTYDYDNWFNKLVSKGSGNYARLWLSPFSSFTLENLSTGLGKYSLTNTWRLDYVVSLAEKLMMRLMICIESFNSYRSTPPYSYWPTNPYNSVNGGPLTNAKDFFSNEEAKKYFKNRLRYLVARYGYSFNILSWELFNEVDLTDDFGDSSQHYIVKNWHAEMSNYIKFLDINKHMVTTSFSLSINDPEIYQLDEIDYSQSHTYGADDVAANALALSNYKVNAYKKPSYIGEFGISGSPDYTVKTDPTGIHIHNGAWSGVVTGLAGIQLTWWWDSFIDPLNLYHIWKPISGFVKGIQFSEGDWEHCQFSKIDNVNSYGISSNDIALVWIQNSNSTWYSICINKIKLKEIPSSAITVNSILNDGLYQSQCFDTTTGELIFSQSNITVKSNTSIIKFPKFLNDIACKLFHQE
ncbi:hypothetical protein M0812_18818 [Anaeramoeba flamelloides]|uniref:DUF5060 domain-containing protein n=1 Tax=Anaeramoeba flamelloides TaxID=1746091 RepID=A0AAV7Z6X9_9EUKA|nr:hypothetical protein M0812_18818 [Anaeramoeba flamelloides]